MGSEMSNSLRFASEERQKEVAEMRELRKYTRRFKCISYFFLFFSIFILMNACIGFSSAPFYLPDVNCNSLEPTEECLYLKNLTAVLYFIEMFGSLLMVMHGLLTIAIIDYLKSLRFIRFLIKFTKTVMMLYIILIIVRIGIYIKVHYEVTLVDNHNKDQGFGNFLASYITENKTAAAYITFILMSMFGICFLVNCCTLRTA